MQDASAGRAPFLPFFPAVIATGFLAGIGPGIVAVLLSSLAVDLFWIQPIGALSITLSSDLAAVGIFILTSTAALAISVFARHLLIQARRAREDLNSALQATRDTELRFKTALKGGSIIAWACDAQRRYTWVYNPGAGFSVEDFIGQQVGDVMSNARYPGYADAIDRVFATGRAERLPVTFEHDGEVRHYLSHIEPVLDEAGQLAGLVGSSADVTDLHHAQDAVRRSEKQLRTISDALPVLISLIDPQHQYQFNNAAYERWFGKSTSEMSGQHVSEVLGADAYAAIRPNLERAFGGETFHLETRLPYRLAGALDVSITYIPQRTNGEITGVITLVEDVSARKAAETVIRQNERRWHAMLNAQPECVKVVAADGSVLDMNSAGLAMIEAESIEDVRGRSIFSLIEPTHLDAFRELQQAALSGRPLQEPREFEIVGLKGTRRLMESHCVPLYDEAGGVSAVLSVTRDITERRRAELALHEAAQRKDEFLATLAHELRNPMAPIRYAAASLRKGMPEHALQHAREVIERQGKQMARLLDDLLDMSRVTRNVIELKRATLDLRNLVSEVAETAKPLLTNLQHRLILSIPPDALWVYGDAARLRQVIGNLLDNAAKYTEPGGRIEIFLENVDGWAVMHVKDTGVGLSPEMIPRVFELFAQLHKSLRVAQGGLGIGLTVVKRLVELHDGTVEASSEGLCRGAQFTVRLPLAANQPLAAAELSGEEKIVPLFKSRSHLLIVDDNADAAETLADVLRAEGFPVSVAFDGAAALSAFDEIHPAVVLLDLGLPDMNGIAVARQMRSRPHGKAIQIIAVTGWGQEQDREHSRAAGVDLHLVKPVDPEALLETLARRTRDRAQTAP
jgi:PAS domain S-box-containing protein